MVYQTKLVDTAMHGLHNTFSIIPYYAVTFHGKHTFLWSPIQHSWPQHLMLICICCWKIQEVRKQVGFLPGSLHWNRRVIVVTLLSPLGLLAVFTLYVLHIFEDAWYVTVFYTILLQWNCKYADAFSGMKSFAFRLKFHWSLFPRVQLTITQHWFR